MRRSRGVGLFDGALDPIRAAIRDENADPFVRGQMVNALVILALDRPVLEPGVSDFLRGFQGVVGEMTPDIVWSSWALAVAALGLADMMPLVRQAYDDGRIDPINSDSAFFEQAWRYYRTEA